MYVSVVAVNTMDFQKLCFNENALHVTVVEDTVNTTTTTTALCPCPSETIFGKYSEKTKRLRYFRDTVLSKTPEGREIIRLYYEWRPMILEVIEKDEGFRDNLKEMLDGILSLIGGKVELIGLPIEGYT